MKGFVTRGETFTLEPVTYFVQNSVRSDGNEPGFYLERGYFESLKIYPGHEACNKEVNIFEIYGSINTKPKHGYMCYCDLDTGRGGRRHISSASNSRSPGFKILRGNWVV
jgi:hypothetical protein